MTPFTRPQLAMLVDDVPEGAAWLHELKYDGYRLQALIEGGRSRLLTRNGLDWTIRFPRIAAACAALPRNRLVLDGELVALDARPGGGFQRLQQSLDAGDDRDLVFFAFDLLREDDDATARRPLAERRERLAALLRRRRGAVRLGETLPGTGATLLAAACRIGLEGVISKRLDLPYRSGRSPAWVKVKCGLRQEFVVAGWTPPSGSREGLGALLLAVRDGDDWRYAGRVGSGFSTPMLRGLRQRLAAIERARPPFATPPADLPKEVHWVAPTLVVEVAFSAWTADGRLRHPVFVGERRDKAPQAVRRERAALRPRAAG